MDAKPLPPAGIRPPGGRTDHQCYKGPSPYKLGIPTRNGQGDSESVSSEPVSSETVSSEVTVLPPVESEAIPELACPLASSQPFSQEQAPTSSAPAASSAPPASSAVIQLWIGSVEHIDEPALERLDSTLLDFVRDTPTRNVKVCGDSCGAAPGVIALFRKGEYL